MKAGPRVRILSLLALALLAVSACGQMGPLTLPQDIPTDEEPQDEEDDER